MKLPNAHLVLVGREKITDYLLNAAHPDNNGKAQFLAALGFHPEDWEALAAAFRKLAQTAEVTESLESPHGVKYVLDGAIETPSGKTPTVRTVWIVDRGRNCPRLVTAYPAEP
jgi:hypothetical protein